MIGLQFCPQEHPGVCHICNRWSTRTILTAIGVQVIIRCRKCRAVRP